MSNLHNLIKDCANLLPVNSDMAITLYQSTSSNYVANLIKGGKLLCQFTSIFPENIVYDLNKHIRIN